MAKEVDEKVSWHGILESASFLTNAQNKEKHCFLLAGLIPYRK